VAGADRMTIEEVVRKVLLDEHADVIREAVKAVAAQLMELEVSELIGPSAVSAGPRIAHRIATGIGRGAGIPGRARSSCRSPRSARAATSRASWSRGDGPSRRCSRWCSRLLGCAWQRCTVHFLRDCLGHARRDQHGLPGALIRPIFNCDSLAQARDRLSEAVAHLDGRLGKIATLLEDAEPEILAFYGFPAAHWRKLRSTNPLERFNKEIGRRTDVVGIFPDDHSLIRLAGMLCIEQNDEWFVGRGYLSAASISLVLAGPDDHTDNENKEEVPALQAA
jgi:Transposase, Mutator family